MDSKVQKAIEMVSSVDPTRLMDQELPRLEALLPQVKEGTEEYSLVIRGLTAAYQQALLMVAAAAKAMGYPPQMDEWPGTEPLAAVAELHPVLWGTDWYQRMLGQVIMPVDHHWYVPPTEI